MACVKDIPRSRLLNTAIVSGIYPLSFGTTGMLFQGRALLFAGKYLPTYISRKILDLEFGGMASDPKAFEENFMRVMDKRSEQETRCLDDVNVRSVVIGSMREAFAQGSKGAAWELGLYGDWGFELGDMSGEGVVIWHGSLDVNAPCAMAEKAVGLMKGCEMKVVEGETHFSLPLKHLQEILKDLVERGTSS